jgi:uncharacterized protein YecE (DUF72 family)
MIWVGTSGYNYPEWKGNFYPANLASAKMLPFYAGHFSTVEINYTFYRMPNEKTLAGWAQAVPDQFRFTLKAPRRITHDARLQRCESVLRTFCEVAGTLGPKLGVLLFQLPPNFKKEATLFEAFLTFLPPGARAAFEFRNPSWFDEEIYALLRRRNVALCIADSERLSTPLVETADYGYFRLRDEGYQPDDLARWAAAIDERRPRWRDTFVYFKHEEEGKGPAFAKELISRLGSQGE